MDFLTIKLTILMLNAEGTILNNSAGGGTAQLGDIVVPANPNYHSW